MNKKHVLFIVENAPVPLDPRVWREAKAVKGRGHDVSVICPMQGNETQSYKNIDGIDIYAHPRPTKLQGKYGHLFEYINALFWELILSIKIYFRKPFHVIHAANPPDSIFLVAMVFKLFGVKFIFDIHDLSPELYIALYGGKKDTIYNCLLLAEKLSCKIADTIIATNNSYKEVVVKRHNLKKEKVFIVRNDPVLNEFTTMGTGDVKKSSDRLSLLYLGAINPQDGIGILIQSVYILFNSFNRKNIYCIVIGGGRDLAFAKQKAKELNIEEHFLFTGTIYDRGKIIDYLKLADVCVEPAPYSDINNISTFIKVLEYMASEKAIVAFDLKETRYSAMESAIFVPPGDVEGFAMAINNLLNDQSLREGLGKKGRERIKNELNWDKSLLNLKDAYDILINA